MKTKPTIAFSALCLILSVAVTRPAAAQTSAITATPAQINFVASTGGPPATQTIALTSNGDAEVSFTVTKFSGMDWLTVSPLSGTTPATVMVSATPGVLTTGIYTAFLSIAAGGTSTTVPVNLTVGATGQLTLTASPDNLSFNFATGSTTTQSKNISIKGPSGDTFTVAATTTDGGDWLTVDGGDGTVPGTVAVTVDPSSFGAGSYMGSLTITGTDGTTLVVPVQVTVAVPGVLNLSPQQFSFSYQLGSPTPAAKTLDLTTTATSAISFTASASSQQCGGNWLMVSPQGGTAPASLSVQVNTVGLPAGTCTGNINVMAPSAATPMVSIPVSLVVTTGGLFQIATSALNFTYQVGTALPVGQTIQVNSANNGVAFTATAASATGGPNFLTISPPSGTTPEAVTVSLDSAVLSGLMPNTYRETVTLSSPGAANSNLSIPVTLLVTNNPTLLLTQSSVTFNYQIGQSVPGDQFLSVTSTGAPITFTVNTSTATCPGFLLASAATGATSVTDQPEQLDIGVDPSNLTTPQTCTGTVTLSSAESGALPLTIPVTLNVSSTPLLVTDTHVIVVPERAGAATPVQTPISLTSTDGATPLNFTAVPSVSSGMNWLSVDLNSGSTPATVNVTVDSKNLPVGTYTGSINLSSTTAGVLPLSIPVVLTVSSGTVTPSTTALSFSMSAGGPNPPNQTITFTDFPPGAAVTASATTDGSNFLSVTASGSTVVVSADGSQLSQGSYQGLVTVLVPGASNSPLYLPVTFTINPPAEFVTTPASLSFTYQGGGSLPAAQTVQVNSVSGDATSFTAMAVAPPGSTDGIVFVDVTPDSGTTPGTLSVSLDPAVVPSLAAGSYTDLIYVTSSADGNSQSIPVTLVISAVGGVTQIVSGASFQPGPVSPGEVITIFGNSIGPATPAGLTLNASNMVETTLNNTTVTFYGVPAPLIFVSSNQINAVVPYEVATQTNVPVVITSGGTVSTPFNVDIAPAVPAIFALGQGGSGAGAILNENGSLNEAAHPAATGSVIVIFATGEGVTTPPATTGSVTVPVGNSYPLPDGTVSVTIGGIDAQILYAGEAPGLVSGVLQVNAVIPQGTGSGNQPVVLTVGSASSPTSVTVAIQ